MTIALFVGRFQPFHKGHLKDIKSALKECDEVIIAIGSSQHSNKPDNPFTFEERVRMIEDVLSAEGIEKYTVFAVPDIIDDFKWVEHVETLVPKFDIVYTGNSKTEKLFRKRYHKVKRVEVLPGISSTIIRKRMLNDRDWRSLVPKQVSDYIDDIDGVKRVKEISE